MAPDVHRSRTYRLRWNLACRISGAPSSYSRWSQGSTSMTARLIVQPSCSRWASAHAAYSPRIDAAARALEADQHRDEAVAAALRDRLDVRRAAHREVIARIANEGLLAEGWTIDSATDVFSAVTMLSPWRELTEACGWSAEQYAERMSQFVREALIARLDRGRPSVR